MAGKRWIEDLVRRLDAAQASEQRLIAEMATLRKNAERYLWLREGCNEKRSAASRIAADCFGLEWDAKIDAAMAGQG